MKINVTNLKDEVTKLKKLTNEFDTNVLNIYNILKNVSTEWRSEKATRFFRDVEQEKNSVRQFVGNINDLNSIYGYIISQYGRLGRQMEIILSSQKEINDSLYVYITSLKEVLKKFQSLTLTSKMPEKNQLIAQKKKLEILITKSRNYRTKINQYFKNIKTIENNIDQKIRKLSTKYINQKNINQYQVGNTNQDITFSLDNFERTKLKLTYYKKEELTFFNKFNTEIENIEYNYQSKNKENLATKINEFKTNFKKIEAEHQKNIDMISSEIVFYKSLHSKVATSKINKITKKDVTSSKPASKTPPKVTTSNSSSNNILSSSNKAYIKVEKGNYTFNCGGIRNYNGKYLVLGNPNSKDNPRLIVPLAKYNVETKCWEAFTMAEEKDYIKKVNNYYLEVNKRYSIYSEKFKSEVAQHISTQTIIFQAPKSKWAGLTTPDSNGNTKSIAISATYGLTDWYVNAYTHELAHVIDIRGKYSKDATFKSVCDQIYKKYYKSGKKTKENRYNHYCILSDDGSYIKYNECFGRLVGGYYGTGKGAYNPNDLKTMKVIVNGKKMTVYDYMKTLVG